MNTQASNAGKIFMYTGNNETSGPVSKMLAEELIAAGYQVTDDSDQADLIACVGGDGTFLHFIQECNFPECPILGVNTGHLGFFQELEPADIPRFMTPLLAGDYQLQDISPVKATIYTGGTVKTHLGLNEVLIRGPYTHVTHFTVYIGDTKIQDFSGDGILFSTPVGSTAYNYALGGAIISPDLHALQMTPVAPSNTNAYRCFPSSIMYSDDHKVTIVPIRRTVSDPILLSYDGLDVIYDHIDKAEITKSNKSIRIIRFSKYDYWEKLTSKLL